MPPNQQTAQTLWMLFFITERPIKSCSTNFVNKKNLSPFQCSITNGPMTSASPINGYQRISSCWDHLLNLFLLWFKAQGPHCDLQLFWVDFTWGKFWCAVFFGGRFWKAGLNGYGLVANVMKFDEEAKHMTVILILVLVADNDTSSHEDAKCLQQKHHHKKLQKTIISSSWEPFFIE